MVITAKRTASEHQLNGLGLKKASGYTLISRLRSEIEMKLQYAIRGAGRGEICLADSEAQGSAVRQSLCADCQAEKPT